MYLGLASWQQSSLMVRMHGHVSVQKCADFETGKLEK